LYLFNIKYALYVTAYFLYLRWISFNILQLRFVDSLYIRILTSFTKLIENIRSALLFVILRRSAMKNKNRINEISKFYKISIIILNGYDSFSNSLIIVIRFYKKLRTQSIIIDSTRLFRKLWISLSYKTLSNTSEIFILSKVTTFYDLKKFYII
jgi:hypothetical protein